MKPLVYYCRWQGVSLRLRGRDDTAVWGELVTVAPSDGETMQPFHYLLRSATLTLCATAHSPEQVLILDEMGVPQTNQP